MLFTLEYYFYHVKLLKIDLVQILVVGLLAHSCTFMKYKCKNNDRIREKLLCYIEF